jgi:hypothetical protein
MRPVLRTTNLALVESARLALESEEIPAVTSNAYAAGLPFNLVTIAVLSDADFARAITLIDDLQRDSAAADGVPVRPRHSQLFGVVLLALVALYALLCQIG